MRKLKLILTALVFAMNISVLTMRSAVAHGEENDGHAEVKVDQADTINQFVFVTPKGCSLSLLVRRSLQLYDQENESVNLSPAAIIYAETNIVKDLGGRLLEVGERVTVDKSQLADYATKSASLSAAALAAWQKYANRANFNLDYITPESDSATSSTSTDSAQSEQKTDSKEGNKDSEKKRAPMTWQGWLVGLGAVAVVYFLARKE